MQIQKHFNRKIRTLKKAAERGELSYAPGTADVRVSKLQAAYREKVLARFEKIFGKGAVPRNIQSLDADHPID